MKKENSVLASYGEPTGRITRARAAARCENVAMLHGKPPLVRPDKKQVQLGKTKRDEKNYAAPTAAFQQKKRAVLRDVTNICCKNSSKSCISAKKLQAKVPQRIKLGLPKAKLLSDKKINHLVPAVSGDNASVLDDEEDEQIQEVVILESQESASVLNTRANLSALQKLESLTDWELTCDSALFEDQTFRGPELICHTKHVIDDFCKDPGGLSDLDFVDIDSDHTNPQMCTLYTADIYTNMRSAELLRRPYFNFMETVQKDINHTMRGILIDWLVEVSDEYKLVPDTLYLTVNIIDRYLSQNYIERQRLQLLGITCMLIASKYEEICAPPVEEFCFITDNTYSKREVLEMEVQVVRHLGFQLSVPTIKTFLRRFIRAALTSYEAPPQTLSHLANYLAELTLAEYSFLKFLPSVIAASAVFLARWTVEQADHPWNRTLEHYTSYKASELKPTITALWDLQMNSNNCPLNAIREKYKQPKFQSVASMTSPKLLQSLFH